MTRPFLKQGSERAIFVVSSTQIINHVEKTKGRYSRVLKNVNIRENLQDNDHLRSSAIGAPSSSRVSSLVN